MGSKWMFIPVYFFYLGIIVAQNKVVNINVSNIIGQPKKLLSVNVGPDSSILGYKDCGINQIRTHDYYGPCDYWTYTVNALNPSTQTINSTFNPLISSSYQWGATDNKVDSIVNYGFTPFFRLGISWPNSTNVPKFPPIDPSLNAFTKFASICKQTVRHYTAGWDNGRYYNIPYWEVWNEPDFGPKFWTGPHATPINFFKMYKNVVDSIKSFNPQLKVGGPGVAYSTMLFSQKAYRENFIQYCSANSLPLDFYSWHLYDVRNPYSIKAYGDTIRNILNFYGYTNTESIITEIHPDLEGTEYNNTAKGAVWIVSALITTNFSEVDNFFWYRGTALGPLVLPDNSGAIGSYWNGLGYKAYKLFARSINSLVQHDGDEFVTNNFTSNVNSFLTIAGKSTNNDTISLLISNLNSTHGNIQISIDAIPWTGNTTIEQYSIRQPNDKLQLTTTSSNVSNGNLTHIINGANSPSAFLIKIYKNVNTKTLNESDQVGSKLIIYPDPVEKILTISSENLSGSFIVIKNIFGQDVKTFSGDETKNQIDVSELKSGIYFISDGTSLAKFIKL